MRKAITVPLPDHNTLNPCVFGLLARNFQTKRKQSKSFWQRLSGNQETDEAESNEGSSISSNCSSSFKEPLHRGLSARFEDYLRRRMLLRDLLDPQHINSILKIFFYTITGIIVFILVGYAILTLQEDIMKKKAYEMEAIMSQINQCTKEYFDNKCESATHLPPIQKFCMEKEKCMLQDPDMAVRGTKITFALIGEALNELINPLSWKTILVLFAIYVGSVYAVNHSLGCSNPTQNFRQSFEYDEINSRLKRIERFSGQKENFCIQDERRR